MTTPDISELPKEEHTLLGRESKGPGESGDWFESLSDGEFQLSGETKWLTGGLERSTTAGDCEVRFSDDHVVTVGYENGLLLFYTGAEFREEFRENLQSSRDGQEVFRLGDVLRPASAPDEEINSRGLAKRALKWVVKWVGISDIGGSLMEQAGNVAGRKLCRAFEDATFRHYSKDIQLGLRRFDPTLGTGFVGHEVTASELQAELQKKSYDKTDDAAPLLLFIHGTASSAPVAFRDFANADRPASIEVGRRLKESYENRIVAFQHRTLTESPVQNAIELVKALPKGAILHIVSHSRGGLIGELLCRGQRVDSDGEAVAPFDQTEIRMFQKLSKSDSADDEYDGDDGESLELLAELLKEKQLKVKRFVRVACPARGTTLVSGKLDRCLSVAASLLNITTGALGSPAVERIVKLLTHLAQAIVKSRTDTRTLPGLACMLPDSSTVRLVCNSNAMVEADLTVVAGRLRGQSIISSVTTWLADLFFEGDSDAVVNTASMYSGARRYKRLDKKKGSSKESVRIDGGRSFLDPRASTWHSSYFGQHRCVQAVADALLVDSATQFRRVARKQQSYVSRGAAYRFASDDGRLNLKSGMENARGKRPIVILLPGIMGSHLSVGDDRIWASVGKLAWGGMSKLRTKKSSDAVGPGDASAEAIFNVSYGRIAGFLSATHDVVPFEYDWRMPVSDAAERLKETITELLRRTATTNMPISLLAHSMGGLVARAFMVNHPREWRDVSEHVGSHTVMLGTPLHGSFRILDVLSGRDAMIGKLATLDVWNSQPDILKVVASFPGMLDLLPRQEIQMQQDGFRKRDFFAMETWRRLKRAMPDLTLPDANALKVARLGESVSQGDWNNDKVLYVHGVAPRTPIAYEPRDSGFVRFWSKRGDGSVLWDLGDVPIRRWWMPAEHGSLADHQPAFPALRQLLQNGALDNSEKALLTAPPAGNRSTVDEDVPQPTVSELHPPVMLPTDLQFQQAAAGVDSNRTDKAKTQSRIRVSLVHGDLKFSRHPVLVGHYEGAPIVGAEKSLDGVLNGQLSDRQTLGVYPGAERTSLVLLKEDDSRCKGPSSGAIVVGLGDAGELSSALLRRSTRDAFLNYVTQYTERFGRHPERYLELSVSPLLVGTGSNRLTCRDSLTAIIHAAIDANEQLERLQESGSDSPRVILRELEFIELNDTWATEAFEALNSLADDSRLAADCQFSLELQQREGHQRGRHRQTPSGWWDRVRIETEQDDSLSFTALTQRALVPSVNMPLQRNLINALLEKIVNSTLRDQQFQRAAGTLYQELFPETLRIGSQDATNHVLILDERAAAIPWETLADIRGRDETPLSVSQGIIRQLASSVFAQDVKDTQQLNALVIGDPVSDLPPLPDALLEAELVADTLTSFQVDVNPLMSRRGVDIISALHESEYRILHFAGHGVHEFDWQQWRRDHPLDEGKETRNKYHRPVRPVVADTPREEWGVSGMVLGDDIFLTPEIVSKLRGGVPELVFINCCHLGKAGEYDDGSQSILSGRFHKFAANIGVEFMRKGVRAVIAAGWAVNDAAAKTFAHVFYDSFLQGETFGESVNKARRATYDRHHGSNTWAAYQCYGDPTLRLRPKTDTAPTKTAPDRPTDWVNLRDLLDTIYNLRQKVSSSDGQRRPTELEEELLELESGHLGRWEHDPRVISEIGLAYMDLGNFQTAEELLRKAVDRGGRHLDFDVVDQFLQCRVRNATESVIREKQSLADEAELEKNRQIIWSGDDDKPDSTDFVPGCIQSAKAILNISPAPHRHLMLGSFYMRLAALHTKVGDVRNQVGTAADHFQKAVRAEGLRYKERQTENRFGRHNQATQEDWDHGLECRFRLKVTQALQSMAHGNLIPGFDIAQSEKWCRENQDKAVKQDCVHPGFRAGVWQGHLPLLRLLLCYADTSLIPTGKENVAATEAKLQDIATEADKHMTDAIEAYQRAMRRGSSPRNRIAVFEDVALISLVLQVARRGKPGVTVAAEKLAKIKEKIWQER